MQTVRVALADRSYPIYIGERLLARAELLTQHMPQRRAALITDSVLAPLYLEPLAQTLAAAGVNVTSVVVPTGEQHKDWGTLNTIFDALLANRCERKTTLIALGGGVIGDLTGFAAATYLRGVPFIQVPTTLLAQVDSSVGGKTAINHPQGKNMIGAFYQPLAVLADTTTLNSLPQREVSAGLAEVIKYGLIRDSAFFAWLESNVDALIARDAAALAYAIQRSCENKAEVVAADEREESGARAVESRPYLRTCDRSRSRLWRLAAWRSGRCGHGDRGACVAADGPDQSRRSCAHRNIAGTRPPAHSRP